jgi:hypothetical protein
MRLARRLLASSLAGTLLSLPLLSCSDNSTEPNDTAAAEAHLEIVNGVAYPLVTITPAISSLGIGDTVRLSTTLRNSGGGTWTGCCITWKSSDTSIATVSSNTGVTVGRKAGQVTITATTLSNTSGTLTFTVGSASSSVVAAGVSNVRVATGKSYEVAPGGMATGAKVYIDRSYVTLWVPSIVEGATYIRTANNDKNASPGSTSFLSFDVDRDVVVYVAHDRRLQVPAWLKSGFQDVGTDIVNSDYYGKQYLRLFKRSFPKGRVTLGSNVDAPANGNMYMVIVTAAGSSPSGDTTPPTISITSPAAGSTISGTVTIVASASDNVKLAGVKFEVDTTVLEPLDTDTPYSQPLNTTTLKDGTHTIKATAVDAAGNTKAASIQVTVKNGSGSPSSGTHAGWYVAPNGSSGGAGTASAPWDLATGLTSSRVQPGDTVWLRGGTYHASNLTATLTGTSSAPIIVRQYPGERATIDGNLNLQGAYTWYWGFEIMSSILHPEDIHCFNVYGPQLKLINLVVHDCGGNGLGVWDGATEAEVYGTLVYNNGRWNAAHGIYSQNSSGTKHFLDNVLFNQRGYGFHIYTEGGSIQGFELVGNVAFDNGATGPDHVRPNIFVGSSSQPAARISVVGNLTYTSPQLTPAGAGKTVELGYGSQNQDLTLRDNYFAGGWPVLKIYQWATATITGNVIYSPGDLVNVGGTVTGFRWTNNRWYQNASETRWQKDDQGYPWSQWTGRVGVVSGDVVPAVTPRDTVVVRPNRYERGRANIIVYNWDLAGSVSVDLSGVLQVGDRYEVRNVQSFFGAPVVSGTYSGGPITLPMTAVAPPTPVGGFAFGTVPATGPEFNVFVVLKQP